jgi:hypothetical protein
MKIVQTGQPIKKLIPCADADGIRGNGGGGAVSNCSFYADGIKKKGKNQKLNQFSF